MGDQVLNPTAALTRLPTVTIEGIEFPTYRDERGREVMQDLDIGRALEIARPRNIRKVISAHIDELGEVRSRQEQTSEQGGRPGVTYYLTEEQALAAGDQDALPELLALFYEWGKTDGGGAK